MSGTTILAVDLGKYKSVACAYHRATAAAESRTVTTSRAEVERLIRSAAPCLPAPLDVPGEPVQDGLPAGPLLLGGVRPLRVEGFPDGDTVARPDELNDQGAVAEGTLDQLVGDDL